MIGNYLLTIVHGNDDVVVTEHATLSGAKAAATVSENERHGTKDRPLSSFFDWIAPDRMQYGTDYHYVNIEEV